MRLDLDTDAIAQGDIPAALAQIAAAQSALTARLLGATAAPPQAPAAPAQPPQEKLLTVPEVAKILGFSPGYTYALLRSGQIAAFHHGKFWRVRASVVDEFIRAGEGRSRLDRSLARISRLRV
jgi:excisionase family DNA binding protein